MSVLCVAGYDIVCPTRNNTPACGCAWGVCEEGGGRGGPGGGINKHNSIASGVGLSRSYSHTNTWSTLSDDDIAIAIVYGPHDGRRSTGTSDGSNNEDLFSTHISAYGTHAPVTVTVTKQKGRDEGQTNNGDNDFLMYERRHGSAQSAN